MLTYSLKETKNNIVTSIINSLVDKGFIYDDNKCKFIRTDSFNNEQNIFLKFYDDKTFFRLEIFTEIKIEKMTKFFNLLFNTKNNIKYGSILNPSLGDLIYFYDKNEEKGGAKNRVVYLIESDNDVKKLSDIIPARIREYIFPYFNSYSSTNQMDKLLNNKIGESILHHFLFPTRACFGVLVAELTHNTLLQDIIAQYRKRLEVANISYQNDFEKVVEEINKDNFVLQINIDFNYLK